MHQTTFHSAPKQGNNNRYSSPSLTESIKTACGGTMVIPLKAQEHLRAHPVVRDLLPEAISNINLPDSGFLAIEVEMGRVIGVSGTVEVPAGDMNTSMYFARRIDRAHPSRVVISKAAGQDSSTIVVLAYPSRTACQTYVLVTAWVGSLAAKEPWDLNISSAEEFQMSINFWCSNALIYDEKIMGEVFESTWNRILNRCCS